MESIDAVLKPPGESLPIYSERNDEKSEITSGKCTACYLTRLFIVRFSADAKTSILERGRTILAPRLMFRKRIRAFIFTFMPA